MLRAKTFPHFKINVKATDNYKPTYEEILPLHRPIFFMRCAKGPINVPIWCPDINYATRVFGEETFEETSEYFSREAKFVKRTFMKHGCFMVRLADIKADYASAIIEAHIIRDTMITQYELDSEGRRIVDEYGEYIPRLDGANNIVKELGMKIKYTARKLNAGEKFNEIKERTVRLNNKDILILPIQGIISNSPSSLYNNTGFKMYFSARSEDPSIVNNIQSRMFVFNPVEIPYQSSTEQPIYDRFSYTGIQFTFKPDQLNKDTNQRVSGADMIETNYTKDDEYILPYQIHWYSDYVGKLCNLVQTYEIDNVEIQKSAWLANILSFRDNEDRHYSHVELDVDSDGSILFNDHYTIYLSGGSDGDMSNEIIEDLTRQYLALKIYPELADQARYPITHLYDTGVTLRTKFSLIDFMGRRDDVKISLSTQDCNREKNTKDEDQSTGSALRARCLLQPESIIFGTGCCRAEIAQQAGNLIGDTYKNLMPMTYELLAKRSSHQGTTVMSGKFKGLPESGIDYIGNFWTPCSDDHKQLSWDTGLNYAQYYDMRRKHWADFRTVYDYATSVLSDTTFTDAVVYSKHIIRRSWATHVGLDLAAAELHRRIEKDIDTRMFAMCGNMYPSTCKAWQSAEEMKIGYITHVTLNITGYGVNRVWDVDVICNRENYSV